MCKKLIQGFESIANELIRLKALQQNPIESFVEERTLHNIQFRFRLKRTYVVRVSLRTSSEVLVNPAANLEPTNEHLSAVAIKPWFFL